MAYRGPFGIDSAARAFLGRDGALFIEGAPSPGASAERLPVYNPSSGEPLAEVPDATPADVDAAVRCAQPTANASC